MRSVSRRLRTVLPAAFCAVALASLADTAAAQDFQRPDGWKVRFDDPSATEAELEMFVAMPPGWHVTSGPAAIYWDPASEASGAFRVDMEVYLFDPGQRREAFGIFVGGRDLEGAGQSYVYFLIRNGGEFIVKRRLGPDTPTVAPWSRNDAILSYAERGDDASVKNVLTVEADDRELRFLVNGVRVWTGPRSDFPVDGRFGFRVNHGLNLHVSRLEATPAG